MFYIFLYFYILFTVFYFFLFSLCSVLFLLLFIFLCFSFLCSFPALCFLFFFVFANFIWLDFWVTSLWSFSCSQISLLCSLHMPVCTGYLFSFGFTVCLGLCFFISLVLLLLPLLVYFFTICLEFSLIPPPALLFLFLLPHCMTCKIVAPQPGVEPEPLGWEC